MKFITSRIISPKEVKSLMQIIAEKQQTEVKTTPVDAPKIEKTAAVKEVKVVEATKVEKPIEKVAEKKVTTENTKEYSIKKIESSKEDYSKKLGIIWKKIKSTAALSTEDRSFLLNYFKRYYPADYVEALLAQY